MCLAGSVQRFGRDAKCTAQAVQCRGTVLRFTISLVRHVRVCAGSGFPARQAIYRTQRRGVACANSAVGYVLVHAIVCFCIRPAAIGALETDIWIKQAKRRLSVLSCCSRWMRATEGMGVVVSAHTRPCVYRMVRVVHDDIMWGGIFYVLACHDECIGRWDGTWSCFSVLKILGSTLSYCSSIVYNMDP